METFRDIQPLPILQAFAFQDHMSTGRTKPALINCMNESTIEEYVVKLKGSEDLFLKTLGLANEVFGSLLAAHFDIATPKIALIKIPQELSDAVDREHRKVFRESVGLNFGSRFVFGAKSATTHPIVNLHKATQIFFFDMLCANPDRRKEKPNSFVDKSNYIIYDHELAFEYALENQLSVTPKSISDFIPLESSKDHLFFSGLKRKLELYEIEHFLEKLSLLSDEKLGTIKSRIPIEWNASAHCDRIIDKIIELRHNPASFKRNIQELLS